MRHANIVTAYAALRVGESFVLAMEYVEGLDLAKLVKAKGPLPVAHACRYIHQAALGLQHAHEHGMVHRDIKPANLILSREGNKALVKVLDFGLAKVSSERPVDRALTREGQTLGTPDFMAPEQIRDAQSSDVRADIYSLGCTLYYLLTGGPPFEGDHLWDIYQAHFSRDAEPLNLARPEVPVELAALVAKMMAKEPDKRFQTPGAVALALTPFFKQAASQPAGSSAEISRVNPPVTPTQTSEVGPPPLPRTEPAVSVAAGRGASRPGAEAVAWESLIELRDTEESIGPPKPKAAPKPKHETGPATTEPPERRPLWRRWPMVACAAVPVLLALGLIIWMATVKAPERPVQSSPTAEDVADARRPGKVNPVPKGEAPPVVKWSPATAAILAKLEMAIPMKYPNETTLEVVVRDIKKATKGPNDSGIPIYVDPLGLQEAEKSLTSTVTINVEDVALRSTLSEVLGDLGLTYIVSDGLLTITCVDEDNGGRRIDGPREAPPVKTSDRSPKTLATLEGLATPIAMRYPNETPLETVIDDIKKATKVPNGPGIQIHVAPNGLKEAEKSMGSTVRIDVEGVPLRTTLRCVLMQLGLDYFVRDGMLVISDAEGIDERFAADRGQDGAPDTATEDGTTGSSPGSVAESRAPDPVKEPPAPPAPTGALSFDGRTRITFGGSGTDMAKRDYTIFARIKTRLGGTIFSKTNDGNWVPGGKALFVGGGSLVFAIGDAGEVRTERRIDDDRWHDVAMTYTRENHEVRLFIDGRPERQGLLEPKAPTSPVMRIGYGAADFPEPPTPTYFNGQISELRFYQQALTDAQIAALPNEPDGIPPVRHWMLGPDLRAPVRDLTAHGYLGKLEIASAAPVIAVADKPASPEEVLKKFGVRLDDGVCMLDDETPVLQAVNEAQRWYVESEMAYMEQQAMINAEQVIPELQAWLNQYQVAIAGVDQGIAHIRRHGRGMHPGAHQGLQDHKKQLQAEKKQVSDLLARLRTQAFDPNAGPRIAERLRTNWQNYERARGEFRRRLEATRKRYKELHDNKELREALAALGRRFGDRFELVPSGEFIYIVEWFEELLRNERRGG